MTTVLIIIISYIVTGTVLLLDFAIFERVTKTSGSSLVISLETSEKSDFSRAEPVIDDNRPALRLTA